MCFGYKKPIDIAGYGNLQQNLNNESIDDECAVLFNFLCKVAVNSLADKAAVNVFFDYRN